MHTEDGSIIQKCLNGEPEAFGLLVDKYKAGIYSFVYSKLQDFHNAQDVTQEVFIQAYRDLHSLKQWESFVFWLYRIASTKCKTWVRSKSRHPDFEFIADQDPSILENHSINSYHTDQKNESLQDALNTLPEIYREVLLLHYFGGMTSKDISKALGISASAVLQRLTRARSQLREEMIGMMGEVFSQQRLQAGFTFHIAEIVKKIKINPVSQVKGLPWGLSLGTGLIFAFLMFGQHIQINLSDISMGLPLPSDMKVLKVGEIPVDAVKVSTITSIGNKGDGNGFAPDLKGQDNAFFMSPQGEGEWTKKVDMPTARADIRTVVVNGKIYAIGGYDGVGALPNVEEYDPIENKWEIRSSMPQPKTGLCVCSVNGKIYVFGGFGLDNNKSSGVYEYDPVLDKWTVKNDISKTIYTLQGVGACPLNSKIYFCGYNADDKKNYAYEYDPARDSWTEKAEMLTSRVLMNACAVNGKMYVIGGRDNAPGPVSTVEEYDPVTDTWKKKSDMPTARVWLSVCAVGTKIYAMGGYGWVGFFATVEIYDTLTDTWTKGVDMQIPRGGFSASVVGGKIYSIGGYERWEVILSSVEEFDTGFISVDPSGKLPKTWGTFKAR